MSENEVSFIGDKGGYFPTAESAQTYRKNYKDSDSIQTDRVRSIKELLKGSQNGGIDSVLYFGIGDGTRFIELDLNCKSIIGVDISPYMIEMATTSLRKFNFKGVIGDQKSLTQFNNDSFDLILLIHVLGYIPLNDRHSFFLELRRIIKPSGKLIISTGNKLFDLFALNSGTKTFFEDEFHILGTEKLLTQANKNSWVNATRENPLSIDIELGKYGLIKEELTFSQYHVTLPELKIIEGMPIEQARSTSRDFNILTQLSELEKWQAYFRCSSFAMSFLSLPK
jgi:SAM-dependent methyltransferase